MSKYDLVLFAPNMMMSNQSRCTLQTFRAVYTHAGLHVSCQVRSIRIGTYITKFY